MRRHRPVDKMVSDYECGDSLPMIVKRYGVPYTTVRNLLAHAGVKFRSAGRFNYDSDLHAPTSVCKPYSTEMKES